MTYEQPSPSNFLPHQYPFLLIDKISEISLNGEKKFVKCIKNVSINEHFFQGHFPNNPVMPGVLILEAMAQASIILGKSLESSGGNIFYLSTIQNATFKSQVFPGDCLVIKAILKVIKMNFYFSECICTVNDKIVATAEIKAYRPKN
jgi:3-hydroxyacyl-[acyl-carrier-protein] dehydratase